MFQAERMPRVKYTIGVDIGTTSTKAVLYDENLQVVASANEGYPTYHPAPGRAEQDPEEICMAFKKAVRQLASSVTNPEDIRLLSFSSAMHGIMAVDERGIPITRCLIWSDNRAQEQVERLKREPQWLDYYQRTGTPLHSMSPFAKLLWMGEETALLNRAYKFIGIKEYLFYQLTGEYVIDYSIASATGLFNIHELKWDPSILEKAGISRERLSQPVDVTEHFSLKNHLQAEEMGVSRQVRLVIGASDGCLANLGTGAERKGETTLTIGTSGAIRMTVPAPVLDEEGRTFCYYLSPNRWVIGGAVNNGGNALHWLNSVLFGKEGEIFRQLPEALLHTSPGAEGLLFFPFLNGERAPFWNGNLRGTYHGLSSFHSYQHILRATMEGILYNLKEVLELIQEIGGEAHVLKATGGFLNSKEWAQMAADILRLPLTSAVSFESSCLGAVLLVVPEEVVEEVTSLEDETVIRPNSEHRGAYEKAFQRYRWYSRKLVELQEECPY